MVRVISLDIREWDPIKNIQLLNFSIAPVYQGYHSLILFYQDYDVLGKTHIKKNVFFSGRTTKRVWGGVIHPTTKQKTLFFLEREKIHREAA